MLAGVLRVGESCGLHRAVVLALGVALLGLVLGHLQAFGRGLIGGGDADAVPGEPGFATSSTARAPWPAALCPTVPTAAVTVLSPAMTTPASPGPALLRAPRADAAAGVARARAGGAPFAGLALFPSSLQARQVRGLPAMVSGPRIRSFWVPNSDMAGPHFSVLVVRVMVCTTVWVTSRSTARRSAATPRNSATGNAANNAHAFEDLEQKVRRAVWSIDEAANMR